MLHFASEKNLVRVKNRATRRGIQNVEDELSVLKVELAAGAYRGASRVIKEMASFNPPIGDANADSLPDLPSLINRGSDLARNSPLACAAINTTVNHVAGPGMVPQSMPDRRILGISDDEAVEFQQTAEAEFKAVTNTKDFDVARKHNFSAQQGLALRNTLERGDSFVFMARMPRASTPYTLKAQLIEGSRVSNPENKPNRKGLIAGIGFDDFGAATAYHVRTTHPGNIIERGAREWEEVPAYTPAGRPNMLHLMESLRPEQARGVPFLSVVIELIHQESKYSRAEVAAAVINSYFTIVTKNPLGGETDVNPHRDDIPPRSQNLNKNYKLGSGTWVDGGAGAEFESFDPKRPNSNFEAFIRALSRQIGMALGIPASILTGEFSSSFSASRAEILLAYKAWHKRQAWLVLQYCQPIWDLVIEEGVLLGRIKASGFVADPMRRMAWLDTRWTGPTPGDIEPLKSANAARVRHDMRMTTLLDEKYRYDGKDWNDAKAQRDRERKEVEVVGGN